ncbi:MAG: insulinase family protein, partial [Spirochaetia bacterium]|nr:insulinase family protein [Spirochaetia bacterium]
PTVAAYIKYKAGSADETDESSGIAHMLEHMLFKGTKQVGTTDYEKEAKYIDTVNNFARHLDKARRAAEALQGSTDTAAVEKAAKDVEKWRTRLNAAQGYARAFMRQDEDSYLYALHGERGFNAYTNRDLTNYQVELPSNRLEVWARIESDRMANSVLRDFYTERDVVAEERRMRTDNVARSLLFEQFFERIYGRHPYGRSVIGPMKSIQYLNYDQAYAFYKTYYAPNNTVIALVGDIDFDATEALVKRYFGRLERRHVPKAKTPPAVKSERISVELAKQGSPMNIMAWFKPPMPDPDDLALDLLAQILGSGRDSRLMKQLVLKDRVASEIHAQADYPGERYSNLFVVSGVPAPGKNYDQLEGAVLEEIKAVIEKGVTQDELERVRKTSQAHFIYGLRSNPSMADSLSYYETMTGDYAAIFTQQEMLEKVTPAQIQDAARKYLQPSIVMTGRLIPEGAK